MAFHIVHGTPQMIWSPIVVGDTCYIGQLVRCTNEGVEPLGTALGQGDVHRNVNKNSLNGGSTATTNKIYGVVVGTNRKTPLYNATQLADSIVDTAASAAGAEDYVLKGGPWAMGDRRAMVKVALLDPTITLRGPIYVDSLGTAPTVQTVTTATSALTVTSTTSSDEAGVASQSTIYFRTGANAGTYRITDDTSQTVIAWDRGLTVAPTVGDTFVRVNLRHNGICGMQVDSEAMFVDVGATITTNNFKINVTKLDLSVAGQEYVDFRFDGIHFYSPSTTYSS